MLPERHCFSHTLIVPYGKEEKRLQELGKHQKTPLWVWEMHAKQNLLETEPVGGKLETNEEMLRGERKSCYRECQDVRRREVDGEHLGYRCTDPQERLAGGHSPESFPKAAATCSAAGAITASASQGTPPSPGEKNLGRGSLCAAAAGKSHEASFPAERKKKKKAFLSLSLSLGMMGAVVPWPGQRVLRAISELGLQPLLWSWGSWEGGKSGAAAQHLQLLREWKKNSPPSKGGK